MTVSEKIEEWVLKIPNEFNINSITDNGDGTAILLVSDTAWCLDNHNINVGGVNYLVKSIVRNTSVTVIGLPIGTKYTLVIPFFTYGTPKQVNTERQAKQKNGTVVTPMIYLFAPISETINHDSLSNIKNTITFTMSVLNDYKVEQFTKDIVDYSVKAMRYLTNSIISTIAKQLGEVDAENIKQNTKEYPKYAQFFTKSGGEQNIFSEKLSGVENNLTIPLKIQLNSLNLCNS
tara:strand:+ start:551 stop:1249 length:699 start_codon:yes stop_codon:yes gene_type:complete